MTSPQRSAAGLGVQVTLCVVVGPVKVIFLFNSNVEVTCALSCVHVVLVTAMYWLILRMDVNFNPVEVLDSGGYCVIIFCTSSVTVVHFWLGGGVE
jgi:hypothetical protein